MSIESQIAALTTQATNLFNTVVTSQSNMDSAVATANASVASSLQSAVNADASRALADIDKNQTAADRVQTGIDRTKTTSDKTQTGTDKLGTAADRVQTGTDKTGTGNDRVQTGADKVATAADRVATSASQSDALSSKTAANTSAAASSGSATISAGSATSSQNWAVSPTSPDGTSSKSSKSYAGDAGVSAGQAASTLAGAVKTVDIGTASTVAIGGFTAAETQSILDNALSMGGYAAMLAYTGRAKGIRITASGISGFFQYNTALPNTSNGGTRFAHASGTGAWERAFSGPTNIMWFGADPSAFTPSHVAIQAAIDSVEDSRGAVLCPRGSYMLGASVKLPNFITFTGDAGGGTAFNNQTTILNAPQFVNKNPGTMLFATIGNFNCLGGTHAFKFDVTSETAGNRFRNISMDLQTVANVEYNKLMQTTTFENVNFSNAPRGLVVQAWTSNANNFYNCSWTNHSLEHISLNVSEGNSFYGCRLEGGGVVGGVTIRLVDAKSFNWFGGYMESTHTILLQETGSTNGVHFTGVHFTGAVDGAGGLAPYQFVSDGIIHFGPNHWYIKSPGSSKMMITGDNGDKLGANNQLQISESRGFKHKVSAAVPFPASLHLDLLQVTHLGANGAYTNLQMLTGILTFHFSGLKTGGFDILYSRRYHVRARTIGFTPVEIVAVLDSSSDIPNNSTLTLQQKAGSTVSLGTLEAVFAGVVATDVVASLIQWSFECISMSAVEEDHFNIALP